MNDNIYHGQRYDIPADVWEELLKAVKLLKELSPQREVAKK